MNYAIFTYIKQLKRGNLLSQKNGYSKERWFSSYTHADNNAKAERLDYCINVVIEDEKLENAEFIK